MTIFCSVGVVKNCERNVVGDLNFRNSPEEIGDQCLCWRSSCEKVRSDTRMGANCDGIVGIELTEKAIPCGVLKLRMI
jgi:hypothetical protein